MQTKQRISSWQMALTLVVSRMFFIFTDTPLYQTPLEPTAKMLGNLVSIGLMFLMVTPILLLFQRQEREHDFLSMASIASQPLGRFMGMSFLLGVMIVAVSTMVHLQFFIQNTTFPNIKTPIVMIMLFAGGLYAVFLGLEGIARTASLLSIALLISMLLVPIFSYDLIDVTQVMPLLHHPVASVLESAVLDAIRTTEFLVLLLLFPSISASFRESAVKFIALSGAGLFYVTSVTVMVLGDYMNREVFPFFTVSSVVDIGPIKRLDALYMMLWVMIALIRLSVYLLVGKKLIERLFPLKSHKMVYGVFAGLTLVFAMILNSSLLNTKFVYTVLEKGWFNVILVVLFPLWLLWLQRHGNADTTYRNLKSRASCCMPIGKE